MRKLVFTIAALLFVGIGYMTAKFSPADYKIIIQKNADQSIAVTDKDNSSSTDRSVLREDTPKLPKEKSISYNMLQGIWLSKFDGCIEGTDNLYAFKPDRTFYTPIGETGTYSIKGAGVFLNFAKNDTGTARKLFIPVVITGDTATINGDARIKCDIKALGMTDFWLS